MSEKLRCPFCDSDDIEVKREKTPEKTPSGIQIYEYREIFCNACGSLSMNFVRSTCDHDWVEVKSYKKNKKRFMCKICQIYKYERIE
ncbi:MAG: hypothetical protein ACTSR3_00995 [Candidatus Helarchaeota archaeon]